MKKYLFITAVILISASNPGYSFTEYTNNPADLEKLQETFYEAPLVPIPFIDVNEKTENKGKSNSNSMPLFKKTRIKVTNYFREKSMQEEKKLLEKEAAEKKSAEESNNENVENAEKLINFNIFKLKKDEENVENTEGTIELAGEVKEHVTYNEMTLDADIIEYHTETNDIEAIGNPILVFPIQNVILKADKMFYQSDSNVLKAYGNVEIIKDGSPMYGDYFQVNMNEESAFLDNINTKKSYLTVNARKGNMEGNILILENGKMTAEESYILKMQTTMIRGTDYDAMIIDEHDRSFLKDEIGESNIHIKAKDVIVNAKKEHDVITVKDAQVFMGGKKLFRIPSFTAHTNKNQDYFEANYPEFGSRSKLGMFAGPGIVFDIPYGATLKAIPLVNYKDDFGIGGALKYKSANNQTDFAYGSANDAIVMRGRQYLDDKLYLHYGINSYMEDWFMGQRMPKYMAELVYTDDTRKKDFLKEGLDLNFKHRVAAGYMQDIDFNRHDENLDASGVGTTRFKYMAEIAQTLYKYENREKRQLVNFAFVMQGSAGIYGTGDTQFIGRVGPRIHSQYKYWMQDIGYFISGYQDGTPMTIYDTYRYGRSNVYLKEALRVNKYLTLAWVASINLSDDSPNGNMFQENAFFVSVGPDDVKVSLGYDVMRRQTYFTVALALDLKGSSLEYEKMEIKNPDRLSVSEKKDEKLVLFEVEERTNIAKPKMKYAEVIEIEDPNKEQL